MEPGEKQDNLIRSCWPPFDLGLEYIFGYCIVTDRTA